MEHYPLLPGPPPPPSPLDHSYYLPDHDRNNVRILTGKNRSFEWK